MNINDNFIDIDIEETKEWISSIDSILEIYGAERAHFLIESMVRHIRGLGIYLPFDATTAYVNTIPIVKQKKIPGNLELEHRIRSLVRWNATAMVLRAGNKKLELGGHIASFQSAATLYEIGFNYFWKGKEKNGGDLIFFQGHSSPGIYARAFLEGRITQEQLSNFRQEVSGKGISSYPHPWLLPNFWQFPTVSMGLGPLMAIYQARFLKYLDSRGIINTTGRKVWAFCGDGEMDEPESKGAIGLASREGLDNLIFVVNCNLQRLDGPVRGNGKIIQELEADFRGNGWNVIKVIWGSRWDALLAKDSKGLLKKRMEECVDGDYQTYKSKDGAYVREHFFGKYEELKDMVSTMSDDEIWALNRGGHDPHKIYAAYYEAVNNNNGRPTLILAKTIKGYGMGESGEGQNIAHQAKKMTISSLKKFRDRFSIPVSDSDIENNIIPFHKLEEDSLEMKYLHERRKILGGYLPLRESIDESLQIPSIDNFDNLLKSNSDRKFSTTMVFVRILGILLKDKNIGKRIVPIVPDESRTFGMEGMFRQYAIWNPNGQTYTPEDNDQLMFYKESKTGQILQEGINEAGAMSSWIAAATSYTNNNYTMIPFYIYYSIFGFQRIGDLAWAAGDMRSRGFLIGGTSGRTTLNGEGLQHEDGHSHIQSDLIPNCISYDPTFSYELVIIIHNGLKRMYVDKEDVFYYITVMNENYVHPSIPDIKDIDQQIIKGMYCFKKGGKCNLKVNLLGSGIGLNEIIYASDILRDKFKVESNIWSVTSFSLLRREAIEIERYNILHPNEKAKIPYVTELLLKENFPVIASTDYVREFADKIRGFIPNDYIVLGTDGFGRSDSRENLRSFFEIDRYHIVIASLYSLMRQDKIKYSIVEKAIKDFGINPDRCPSWKL